MSVPRNEYPRPQFVRKDWKCLNGPWQFEIDTGDSGLERGLITRELKDEIIVPFCPESPLSGIGNTDFMNVVWYRRRVTIPSEWSGQKVLLHFQAVDYDTRVWVNGVEVGKHRGGFTPFTCDLGDLANAGEEITVVVRARDDHRPLQPRGKQSQKYQNYNAMYTRTTGIWQTVWMEPVPQTHLKRPRITPDAANGIIRLEQTITNSRPGTKVRATLRDKDGEICTATVASDKDFTPRLDLPIAENRRKLWEPGNPHLYDIEIELLDADNNVIDRASSYAGLRSVTIEDKAVKINGKTIFQRLVLDQGYYPDGVMTAPSDEALRKDVELSLSAGFNGARLHEKIFEERFLYHADRMGYLIWGEFPDWGWPRHQQRNVDSEQPGATWITQWLEVLQRDYSHPCIIGWCPMNESAALLEDRITTLDDATRAMFLAAKAMDPTRPVLDASGYSHRVTESDIYDCHDYAQDSEKFKANHAGLADGKPFCNDPADRTWSIPYGGQPFFVSEFGGIWWNPAAAEGDDSWGYGDRPKNIEEFYERFESLCAVLLDNPNMFGYCYTQITDVFQEQNGIYTFDRQDKFDMDRIRQAQQCPAAVELNR
jgi:beta-galactosidase/beta-glucuronidase